MCCINHKRSNSMRQSIDSAQAENEQTHSFDSPSKLRQSNWRKKKKEYFLGQKQKPPWNDEQNMRKI